MTKKYETNSPSDPAIPEKGPEYLAEWGIESSGAAAILPAFRNPQTLHCPLSFARNLTPVDHTLPTKVSRVWSTGWLLQNGPGRLELGLSGHGLRRGV
jgi:hypothetical protein